MPRRAKKDKVMSIRLPEKLKRMIEEEADKNLRSLHDEIVVLLTQAIHQRKFNIREYM